MTRDRRMAELFLARASAARGSTQEDRLPIWTAVAAVTGANVTLWLLIALVLERLLF
jgi:hypothetical protein